MILHRPEVCKGNAFPGISPHGNSLKSWVKFDQPHIPSLSLSLQVHPHHYCHCHDKPFLKCDWLHSMQIKHQLELPSHWLMGMWHRIWSHYQSIFCPFWNNPILVSTQTVQQGWISIFASVSNFNGNLFFL